MIHIIRFAGELNVFHYCHSSEEVGGEGRRGAGGGPRAAFSRSPTLSPPARESRDALRLRLTHSVAVRVCVPSVIRLRSSIEPQPVQLLGVKVPVRGRSVPLQPAAPPLSRHRELPTATAQLTGVPIAYERTVSAIDHCMHAPDTSLYVSISSRSQNTALDGSHVPTRFADHCRP